MFTDYECFPECLYSECGINFDLIATWEGLDDNEQTIVEALVDHGICSDFKEALDKLDEYHIYDGSVTDYAYDMIDDCYDLPEFAKTYFDYEKFGRDLEMDGSIIELSHNVLLIG